MLNKNFTLTMFILGVLGLNPHGLKAESLSYDHADIICGFDHDQAMMTEECYAIFESSLLEEAFIKNLSDDLANFATSDDYKAAVNQLQQMQALKKQIITFIRLIHFDDYRFTMLEDTLSDLRSKLKQFPAQYPINEQIDDIKDLISIYKDKFNGVIDKAKIYDLKIELENLVEKIHLTAFPESSSNLKMQDLLTLQNNQQALDEVHNKQIEAINRLEKTHCKMFFDVFEGLTSTEQTLRLEQFAYCKTIL